jgi:phage terminase large subunit
MREIRIQYEPHPKQREFHKCPAKYRAFVGGVGSGKTYASVNEALYQALAQPGSLGVMVAPTFPMVRDVTLRTFLAICPEELIAYSSQTKMLWRLPNGSEILFRSADKPERLRGLTIAWFGIDEAAYTDEKTFQILQGRLRQRGYRHRGWVTTSPKGKNWIHKYFVEKDGPDYALIRCSSRENPHLPPGFVEDLEASYTGVFARQEIEGEFVAVEGLVYSDFRRDVHVSPVPDGKMFKEVVAGVDWGFTNPAAILVVGVDGDDRAWVLEEFYERRVLQDSLAAVALRFMAQYGITAFYCDPSEPGFIADFVQRGLPAVPGNNDLVPGIAEVSSRLAVQADGLPRLFVAPECVHTIVEFEQYRYKEDRKGAPGEAPMKAFDHAMDALRYCVMGLKTHLTGDLFL